MAITTSGMKRGKPSTKIYPFIEKHGALQFIGYIEVVRTDESGEERTDKSLPLVFDTTAKGCRTRFASKLREINSSYPTAQVMPVAQQIRTGT
jgi:hypothetical protein